MDERPVVTCFLRNDGEVLLLRRSDAVGSYRGQWGGVAGHVADDAGQDQPPGTAARAEIAEETGLADAVTLVRAGEPFPVEDGERRWLVHPFLFDCDSRAVEANEETAEYEWVQAPEILRRETVPRLWTSYDRVRPRVATLREDHTHGSAWLSLRGLETLRDEAALEVERRGGDRETAERDGDGWTALAELARGLREARPSMAVLENRINRVMTAASDERTPAAVEHAARGAVEQAVGADREAAALAADAIGERVATLSRSGTVAAAIRAAEPEAVLVAESRPGGEGVGVAESLADATEVTLTTDAALPFELDEWGADAVLVGADRVLPDGGVVNKVGTRGAALAAAAAGVDCLVVAASDKVAGGGDYDLEPRCPGELYDGDADVGVANPTFDVTPADAVTAVLTEQGRLSTDEVAAVAAPHREWAAWES
ncbi:NUDIX domain-containing protein [Haloarcula onubensis]|uniref:NUDIX domain-containing protein n=1 Tax=Haloarcula onubensis TaxID=2950539 RepID=A0ABU2FMQ6_9EURY|nr:NUDIX domain-containing protein [Halomicroarcula sp. S3CR25-11]MDS0282044.1 NUDIX domain-containing protein [Halomicroarcula sp. S3CR25-11]